MPRSPTAPSLRCVHTSLPVAASSATIERFAPSTYITLPATIGLKRTVPSPAGYVQATSSCFTFDLLICFSAEYCVEPGPPRYPVHVVNGLSSAAETHRAPRPHAAAAAASSRPAETTRRMVAVLFTASRPESESAAAVRATC